MPAARRPRCEEFTDFERIPTAVSARPAPNEVCCVYQFHHHPKMTRSPFEADAASPGLAEQAIDDALRQLRDQPKRARRLDRSARRGSVIKKSHVAASIERQFARDRFHDDRIERVIEVHDEIAAWEAKVEGVPADEADVPAALPRIGPTRPVLGRDRVESGRDLDTDDRPKRPSCGDEDDATHPGADIDERHPLERGRNGVEQRVDRREGRRFIVRCVIDAGPDRLGIELAEKDERFGRDAVLGIEALPRSAAQFLKNK